MSIFSDARAECVRALDIIEQTQLTLFVQRSLPTRQSTLARIDQLRTFRPTAAVEQIRQILNDVLAYYNDPFANYINPDQHKAYSQRRSGDFVGIGLKFRARDNEYPLVIGPLLGGRLADADIQPGDLLILAGDTDLQGLSSREISSALSGPVGSSIKLTLQREYTTRTIEINALRHAVELHYARAEILQPSIGYIKVSRFGADTHERVEQLLENLQRVPVSALVLDLRDNPGGSTRAARIMMSLFAEADWVYCERYKTGKVRRLPREGKKISDLPMAVLINEKSKSSSEILAGALQDYKRAVLVGSPTYGKGLIQKVFPLKPPLGGAVRITIAAYATPSHRLIHGRGIVPDIYVPSAPAALFKETGSLNISDKARALRRRLTEQKIAERYDSDKARALIGLPDTQLAVAIKAVSNSSPAQTR